MKCFLALVHSDSFISTAVSSLFKYTKKPPRRAGKLWEIHTALTKKTSAGWLLDNRPLDCTPNWQAGKPIHSGARRWNLKPWLALSKSRLWERSAASACHQFNSCATCSTAPSKTRGREGEPTSPILFYKLIIHAGAGMFPFCPGGNHR